MIRSSSSPNWPCSLAWGFRPQTAMHEDYHMAAVYFLAGFGTLLAHVYLLVRFGISPALVVSLMTMLGGMSSSGEFHAQAGGAVRVEVEAADPAPPLPPAPASAPAPAPAPRPRR